MQCARNSRKMHFKSVFFGICVACFIGHHIEAALTLEQMTKMMIGLRASCQPRFNLENDAIDGIKQGIFTNDTDLKCYVNCVLELMNMIRNGKLNYNLAIKQINLFMPDGMKETYLGAIEQCKNCADGLTDTCEYSFTMLQCFYKSSPVFMFP